MSRVYKVLGQHLTGGSPFHTLCRVSVVMTHHLTVVGSTVFSSAWQALWWGWNAWGYVVNSSGCSNSGQSVCLSFQSLVQDSRRVELLGRFVKTGKCNGTPLAVSTGAVWKIPEYGQWSVE